MCSNITSKGAWQIMKKSKIMVAVVSLLLVVLCLVGIIVHFNNKKNFKSNMQESYMATIVMKGFELKIPDKYMATYDSEIGLMYWNYEHFDMMIDVAEGDFKQDVLTQIDVFNITMEGELNVLRPYSEFSVDGRSYVYMLYYEAGVPTIHCYTKADEDYLFEIMILCNEMAIIKPQTDQEIRIHCEDLIAEADSIIRTSKATDKPDSASGEVLIGAKAYGNLYEDVEINMSDKFIPKDYVQGISTKAKAEFDIKQDYYCTGSKSKDEAYYLKFYSDYEDTLITVYIQEKFDTKFELNTNMEEGCSKWGDEESYVEEYTVGDNTFYYYHFYNEYVEEDHIVQEYNFVAATDLGDGFVYFIEGKGAGDFINNPEFYKDFMNVNLSKTQ